MSNLLTLEITSIGDHLVNKKISQNEEGKSIDGNRLKIYYDRADRLAKSGIKLSKIEFEKLAI